MEVRLATQEDLTTIYELGFAAYSEEAVKDYNTVINKDKAKQTVSNLVKQNSVLVGLSANRIVAVIIGSISTTMFSDDLIFASMFFFMVKGSESGAGYFLNQVSAILQENKITKLIIGNPEFNHSERMDKFYRDLGLRKLETHYIRDL